MIRKVTSEDPALSDGYWRVLGRRNRLLEHRKVMGGESEADWDYGNAYSVEMGEGTGPTHVE